MTKTGIVYLDFTWNPCGFGCSKLCPTCWARSLASRVGANVGCQACRDFRVHFHPERLGQPAARKKPTTIGVQFTGELFDPTRPLGEVRDVIMAAGQAQQHTYVFLTQQAQIMAGFIADGIARHYLGITARHQRQLENRMRWAEMIRDPKWLSAEPLEGPMNLTPHLADLDGVIIGTNKDPMAVRARPEWIRAMIHQCRTAAVPVFVKQIRATSGRLLTDPAEFPEDLRIRQVPWPLAGEPAGHDHYTPPQ